MARRKRPDLSPFPFTTMQRFIEDMVANQWLVVTMSVGQWDPLLQAAYDGGSILLELDDDEQPLRAFRREAVQ